MSTMVRVQVSMTFQNHRAGDELLVSGEDPDVIANIRAQLFEVIAVETTEPAPDPDAGVKAEEQAAGAAARAAKAEPKPNAARKGKAAAKPKPKAKAAPKGKRSV